jgi:oligosaccharide repeat unit polymerase
MEYVHISILVNFFIVVRAIGKDGIYFLSNLFAFVGCIFLVSFDIPLLFSGYFFEFFKFSEYLQRLIFIGEVSTYLGMLLSLYLLVVLPKKRQNHILENVNTPNQKVVKVFKFKDREVNILFLIGILGYVFMYSIKGIPIFSNNIEFARQKFASGFGFILWPLRILLFSTVWLSFKRDTLKGLLFIVIAILVIYLSGWRGNIAYLAIGVFFTLLISKRINFRVYLFAIGSVLLVSFLGIYRATRSGENLMGLTMDDLYSFRKVLGTLLLYVIARLGVQIRTFDQVVEQLSDDLLYGRGIIMDLGVILPGGGDTLVYYIKKQIGWWGDGGGGLPPTMFGGFYLDFGIYGVIFLSIIAGFIFHIITFISYKKSINDDRFFIIYCISLSSFFFSILGTYFAYYIPQVLVFGLGLFLITIILKTVRK